MVDVLPRTAARGGFVSTKAWVFWVLLQSIVLPRTSAFRTESSLSRRFSLIPRSLHNPNANSNHVDGAESACTSKITSHRREALAKFMALLSVTATTPPTPTLALDMDAFMSQELSSNRGNDASLKEMSDDEALCKFGQPSKERGEACIRMGLPTTLKKGGVDAFGNVDRGTFVRCKIIYVEDPNSPNKGFLMKKTVCD
ncbi:expressed unknown protein [Seminavis robusta]|uniref:Uncharacterized protein n=1 Tax=Seminavis robusta TaxID=568900 RepID=A0A9N8EBM4_9STRA|nr:expressed unknown protein [Seminavis robusta]|eukprot:Sro769_g199850.1 n/a (199) ;mRNA; f:35430-36121